MRMRPSVMQTIRSVLCGVGLVPAILSPALVFGGEYRFESCYARWSETNLVVGNDHIERQWHIHEGLLTATSFRDVEAGVEWLAKPSGHAAPLPAGQPIKEKRAVDFDQFWQAKD